MRFGAVALGIALVAAACTERNPEYCASNTECADGLTCDLDLHRCVPAADAASSSIDAAAPIADAASADAPANVPDADSTAPDAMPGTPDAASPPDATSPPDAFACPGATHQCVEATPAGWQGPVLRYDNASSVSPPACPSTYPALADDLGYNLTAGGTCTCECGPLTGATCNDALLKQAVVVGPSCSTICTDCDSQTIPAGECVALNANMQDGSRRYYFSDPGIAGGSCAPSTTSTLTAPSFDDSSRLCEGAALIGGCTDSGFVCAPKPPAPFEAKLCIYRSGNVACPFSSSFSDRYVRYGSYTDTRACGTCDCVDPTGSCNGHMEFAAACSSTFADGTLSRGMCSATLSTSGAARFVAGGSITGECTATGGGFTGSASPTGPVTMCCLP